MHGHIVHDEKFTTVLPSSDECGSYISHSYVISSIVYFMMDTIVKCLHHIKHIQSILLLSSLLILPKMLALYSPSVLSYSIPPFMFVASIVHSILLLYVSVYSLLILISQLYYSIVIGGRSSFVETSCIQ